MNRLIGKKLLIMGGPRYACEIVESAKAKGIVTLVTDFYDERRSPAKKIADQAFMISTRDVGSIVQLVKREKIDGVITGFTDSTLTYYRQVCEKAGLPCYATTEQIEIATDKSKFKGLCRNFGVPVVEEHHMDANTDAATLESIRYPVLIKPVDNSGGRGISICRNADELATLVNGTRKYSPTGKVIVEHYMDALELTIFYVIQDGEFVLTGMSDRYTRHRQGQTIPLPVAHILPSVYLPDYMKTLNDRVVDMFKSIGIKNGMIFIQAFVEKDRILFYEMGFRLSGTQEYHILKRECGLSTLDMMIHFALTGSMCTEKIRRFIDPRYGKCYCLINFLAKPGRIAQMVGTDLVSQNPNVLHTIFEHVPGNRIEDSDLGTLRQIAYRVFAEAPNRHELTLLMKSIQDNVKIISDTEQDLMLEPLNVDEVLHE